jgi:hypothetical protein
MSMTQKEMDHWRRMDEQDNKRRWEREQKRATQRGQLIYAIHQRVHRESISNDELDWINVILRLGHPPMTTGRINFMLTFRSIAAYLVQHAYAERFALVLKNVMEEAEKLQRKHRMKRPTPDDFFKQFDSTKRRNGTSEDRARDIAKLAVLDHDELVKQIIKSWETIADDAIRALITGMIKSPSSKTAHNILIKLIVRCIGIMRLFDMMLEEGGNLLDPSDEYIASIRDELLVRIN